jgi:hypothetical protein
LAVASEGATFIGTQIPPPLLLTSQAQFVVMVYTFFLDVILHEEE